MTQALMQQIIPPDFCIQYGSYHGQDPLAKPLAIERQPAQLLTLNHQQQSGPHSLIRQTYSNTLHRIPCLLCWSRQ